MKKSGFTLILVLLFLISGCAASNGTVSTPTDNTPPPSAQPDIQPTASPAPTPTPAPDINNIRFDMDLDGGSMTAVAEYKKEDLPGSVFLLNKDFEVTKILCDGEEIDIGSIKEIYPIKETNSSDEFNSTPIDCEVAVYSLPSFEKDVYIEYVGKLDGTTGVNPQINETISPEYTLLRSQTFYHPLFVDSKPVSADGLIETIKKPFDLLMTVNVPKGYTAVFLYEESEEAAASNGSAFTAEFNAPYCSIAASIAKYIKVETKFANYYLLENSGIDMSLSEQLSSEPGAYEFFRDSPYATFGKNNTLVSVNIVESPEDIWWPDSDLEYSFVTAKVCNLYMKVDSMLLDLLNAETEPYVFSTFKGDSCSILFVGNSQTKRYNNNVPEQLKQLAGMYGIDVSYDTVVNDGAELSKLKDKAIEAMQTKKYDFAVFQETGFGVFNELMSPADGKKFLLPGAPIDELCEAAKENGITPVLYNPYMGAENLSGDAPDPTAVRLMTPLYEIAAKRNGAVLVNAFDARLYAYRTLDGLNMLTDDGHSTTEGGCHTACVFASTLLNLDIKDECPANTQYTGGRTAELGQAAWEYVSWFKEHGSYPDAGRVSVPPGDNKLS